jgi:hypothetical protein
MPHSIQDSVITVGVCRMTFENSVSVSKIRVLHCSLPVAQADASLIVMELKCNARKRKAIVPIVFFYLQDARMNNQHYVLISTVLRQIIIS